MAARFLAEDPLNGMLSDEESDDGDEELARLKRKTTDSTNATDEDKAIEDIYSKPKKPRVNKKPPVTDDKIKGILTKIPLQFAAHRLSKQKLSNTITATSRYIQTLMSIIHQDIFQPNDIDITHMQKYAPKLKGFIQDQRIHVTRNPYLIKVLGATEAEDLIRQLDEYNHDAPVVDPAVSDDAAVAADTLIVSNVDAAAPLVVSVPGAAKSTSSTPQMHNPYATAPQTPTQRVASPQRTVETTPSVGLLQKPRRHILDDSSDEEEMQFDSVPSKPKLVIHDDDEDEDESMTEADQTQAAEADVPEAADNEEHKPTFVEKDENVEPMAETRQTKEPTATNDAPITNQTQAIEANVTDAKEQKASFAENNNHCESVMENEAKAAAEQTKEPATSDDARITNQTQVLLVNVPGAVLEEKDVPIFDEDDRCKSAVEYGSMEVAELTKEPAAADVAPIADQTQAIEEEDMPTFAKGDSSKIDAGVSGAYRDLNETRNGAASILNAEVPSVSNKKLEDSEMPEAADLPKAKAYTQAGFVEVLEPTSSMLELIDGANLESMGDGDTKLGQETQECMTMSDDDEEEATIIPTTLTALTGPTQLSQ